MTLAERGVANEQQSTHSGCLPALVSPNSAPAPPQLAPHSKEPGFARGSGLKYKLIRQPYPAPCAAGRAAGGARALRGAGGQLGGRRHAAGGGPRAGAALRSADGQLAGVSLPALGGDQLPLQQHLCCGGSPCMQPLMRLEETRRGLLCLHAHLLGASNGAKKSIYGLPAVVTYACAAA